MGKTKTIKKIIKYFSIEQWPCKDHTESCLYRYKTDTGKVQTCVVGHFIPNNLYTKEIEKESVREVFKLIPEFEDYLTDKGYITDIEFWADIQEIHDEIDPEDWREELIKIIEIRTNLFSNKKAQKLIELINNG